HELEQDYINYALHFSLWHLDTIQGEKREVLFTALKDKWFQDLGVEGKEKRYFYIRNEWRKYWLIMHFPFRVWKLVSELKKVMK
ncbi:MAG: hypothetical protein IKE21_04810, partial [Erysipelotrichaceae bacterium]|nr:hypothetical protein [Erysipelotrichaceae bacterium]